MPANCVELGFLDRSSTGRTPTASDWSDNVTTAPTSNSFAAVGGLRTFRKDTKKGSVIGLQKYVRFITVS